MQHAKLLPRYLVLRFHGWKSVVYAENEAWYRKLAQGQNPRAMVISCCDSRVHVTSIFGADQGEFFIHRNIANLVPPYKPSGDFHGTSAAIEYAVKSLKVAHILVLGHSNCGGVKSCIDLCSDPDGTVLAEFPFVSKWLEILRPKFDTVAQIEDKAGRQQALEHQAILASLENLMTYPAVAALVKDGALSLHGLWHEIAAGDIRVFNADRGAFESL